MERLCQIEIDFIKKSLAAGIRMDGRGSNEVREQEMATNALPQADGSVRVKRGNSEIFVNVVFRSSLATLEHLKLLDKSKTELLYGGLPSGMGHATGLPLGMGHATGLPSGMDHATGLPHGMDHATGLPHGMDTTALLHGMEDTAALLSVAARGPLAGLIPQDNFDFSTLKSSFGEPNPCFAILEKWLVGHKIGCQIELVVIRSDGNVFDLFFEGLREIFASIKIPAVTGAYQPVKIGGSGNVTDLSMELVDGVVLPTSTTFAILNGTCFIDPSFVEEASCDGLIHLFREGVKVSMFYEGSCSYDTLNRIIDSV